MTHWIPNAYARDLISGPPRRILTEEMMDPHQIEMSRLVQTKLGVLLAAGMGLGKTGSVLHGAIKLIEAGKTKKWLIIAPKFVAENTWPDAFWEWEFARDYEFSCIMGTPTQREEALKSPAPFHIINRENVAWLWKKLRKDWPYANVIYDESSRLKAGNKRSIRTKREDGTMRGGKINEFGSLSQARENGLIKRFIELSGTPAPKGCIDLWGQMYLIDLGYRLGATKKAFLERWFDTNKYSHAVTEKDHAEAEILEKISDAMIVFEEKDEMKGQVPPLKPIPVWVNLPDKAVRVYKELQKEYCLEEYDVEAVNNGVLANKLLQISNGFVYECDSTAQPIHTKKIEALKELRTKHPNTPLFVGYNFKPDKRLLQETFPEARVFGETPTDMEEWSAGKISMLLVHPKSAGHGLNFQFGSNIIVWYGLTWSLEEYEQFNKRLSRRGQKSDKVLQYVILSRNTYDERQWIVLGERTTTQNRIKTMVKELQRKVSKK